MSARRSTAAQKRRLPKGQQRNKPHSIIAPAAATIERPWISFQLEGKVTNVDTMAADKMEKKSKFQRQRLSALGGASFSGLNQYSSYQSG
jgi:hypothetical protein